jgi:hypothetical protein
MPALAGLLAAAALSSAANLPPKELVASLFASQVADLTNRGYVCVQVNGADPGAEQLAALTRSDPRVVMGSACTREMDVEKGSFHTATHKPAYFFNVHDFTGSASDNGEVKISIYHHGLWAIYKTLEVRKVNGEWVIVRVKEHAEA